MTFATGSLVVSLAGPQPTITTTITDSLGNQLEMEVVEFNLGDRLRYESTVQVGGGTYSGYFEVIQGGDPIDPLSDPANAQAIQQISNALAGYPKLQKAVAALTHVEPLVMQAKYPEPQQRNLKPLGCVVISTISLVGAAASCATLAGCFFGLGMALVGLAYCAV